MSATELQQKIAEAKGIPATAAARLRGETRAELESDAERLIDDLGLRAKAHERQYQRLASSFPTLRGNTGGQPKPKGKGRDGGAGSFLDGDVIYDRKAAAFPQLRKRPGG